jgi:hypothetical protein
VRTHFANAGQQQSYFLEQSSTTLLSRNPLMMLESGIWRKYFWLDQI